MTWTPQDIAEIKSGWAPPEIISTEEWGKRNLSLSVATSASAGPWSLDQIPFFRPILEALDNEAIEAACIAKATQIGGTQTVLAWLGRGQHGDPGPAMIVLADEDTAKEICKMRIQPMFRSSPALAPLIIEAEFGQESIRLRNAGSLVMAWASSIGRTASRPIRYLILDEICKPSYGLVQAEGSVISRILQRTETFCNKKIVMLSSVTVEGDNMDQQLARCDVIFDFAVPCPKCGAFQPLRFQATEITTNGEKILSGFVRFEEGGDIHQRAASARYQCAFCAGLWTTAEKNAAVKLGKAVPRVPPTGKVKRVGFHISRLLSLFPGGRLESLVETFLLAKNDPLELQSFVNNALAEHWKEAVKSATTDEIMACRVDLPRAVVPDEARVLVAFIDVQQEANGFWFRVRAFGPDGVSWGIDEGQLGTWGEVEHLLFQREFLTADGKPFHIWRAGIDIGGTKDVGNLISRSEETVIWVSKNQFRLHGRIFACKGSSHAMAAPVGFKSGREAHPSGKVAKYGVKPVLIDTDYFKGEFHRRLQCARDQEECAAYLHAETEEWYAQQILAEVKKKRPNGDYEWVRVKPDNHMLDCEIGILAMADKGLFGGIRRFEGQERPPTPQVPKPQQPQTPQQPQPPRQSFNPNLAGLSNPSAFGGGRR